MKRMYKKKLKNTNTISLQVEELKKNDGVNFVTFAIGGAVDFVMLKEWASGPPDQKLFYTTSFQDPSPKGLLDKMKQQFCASKWTKIASRK